MYLKISLVRRKPLAHVWSSPQRELKLGWPEVDKVDVDELIDTLN
jgi:hypothetical protein